MKRLSIALAVLAVVLIATIAEAADSPAIARRSFDVGVDIGLPVAGFIPYGTITGDNGLDGTVSGSGTVSFPYLGLHARLYPKPSWFIQFDFLNYLRQPGQGTWSTEDDAGNKHDEDFKFVVSRFTVLDFGLGKNFSTGRVRPNAGAGLGIHYLSFTDQHADDNASGWAIGPYGQIGVDFTATKLRRIGDLFFGVNIRLDVIYNWAPITFEDSNTDVTLVYIPLSFFASGGLRF